MYIIHTIMFQIIENIPKSDDGKFNLQERQLCQNISLKIHWFNNYKSTYLDINNSRGTFENYKIFIICIL